jgi:hypothetical protein
MSLCFIIHINAYLKCFQDIRVREIGSSSLSFDDTLLQRLSLLTIFPVDDQDDEELIRMQRCILSTAQLCKMSSSSSMEGGEKRLKDDKAREMSYPIFSHIFSNLITHDPIIL